MNRAKLERRTRQAQIIRDRWNPLYRVVDSRDQVVASAATRAEARRLKPIGCYIEKRSTADVSTDEPVSYTRVR